MNPAVRHVTDELTNVGPNPNPLLHPALYSELMEVKRRKRAPLSCLQCKRRKVKCDKHRPACGGCVKNGVGHLCEFVDPPWLTGTRAEAEAAGLKIQVDHPVDENGVVERQRAEIDKLRREVNVLRQVYSSKLKSMESDSEQITVLQKLRNVNSEPDTIEFDTDYCYTLRTHTNCEPVHLFCWENVINLDPRLTDLWSKVSTIQKAYYQYKKKGEGEEVEKEIKESEKENEGQQRENERQQRDNERQRRDKEERQQKRAQEKRKLAGTATEKATETADSEPDFDSPEYYHESIELLKRTQNVWQKILSLSLPDEKFTCAQLTFILDFYFNGSYSSVSRDLLSLYESRVRGLYGEGPYGVRLNINDVPNGEDDSARYHFFRFLLVYLCMMGIMAEEVLEHFRLLVQQNLPEDLLAINSYKQVFSDRVLTHSNGHSRVVFCTLMLETLEYIHTPVSTNSYDPIHHAFPFYSCCLALLNRMFFQFCPRYNHLQAEFQSVFNMLVLELICDGELPLWTNPKHIHAQKPGIPESAVNAFRSNFGLLWSETVRMFNLQALLILFSKPHHKQQSQLFNMIWDKILNDPDRISTPDGLGFSFAANILICRIASCLYGTTFDNSNKFFVTTANIFGLINECSAHLDDERLHKLDFPRRFEYGTILLFLRYYLNYINILQGQECNNHKVAEFAEIGIVQNAVDCLQHLSKCLRTSTGIFIVYLTSEILPYVIQFNIGTIIRLDNKDQDSVSRISKETAKVIQTLTLCDPADYCNYKRFTKMWDFFQSYVRTTKMLSPEGYASLHAGVPGMLPASCPVLLGDPAHPKPRPNGPHGSCPISGICNLETELIPKKPGSGSRCPIDHSSSPRGIKSLGSYFSLSKPPTPPIFPALTPAGTHILSQQPYTPAQDIDWSNFEHLDFDFLPQLSFI